MNDENIQLLDYAAFGKALKTSRLSKQVSVNQLANHVNLSPRYISAIESGTKHPSLDVFHSLVTTLNISVDQIFYINKNTSEKTMQRKQLDVLLDNMNDVELRILMATALELKKAETDGYIKV